MSCPHTETTAILAVFGEAPTSFEAHLQDCPDCLRVVREHTSTLAAIEPMRAEVRAPKKRWSPASIGFLVAASALFAFQFGVDSDTGTDASNQPLTMEVDLFDDPIDENLTSIELEIELFHLEES